MGGMAEKEGDRADEEGDKSGVKDVVEGRKRGRGEAETGRIRVTFGKDRWGDEAGRERGTGGCDKEGREVVVERIHGIREGEYARPSMGVGGVGRRGRGIGETAGARDGMGKK